jgi:hypothetical protein
MNLTHLILLTFTFIASAKSASAATVDCMVTETKGHSISDVPPSVGDRITLTTEQSAYREFTFKTKTGGTSLVSSPTPFQFDPNDGQGFTWIVRSPSDWT